jgi:hypothetical protein
MEVAPLEKQVVIWGSGQQNSMYTTEVFRIENKTQQNNE